MRLLVGGVQRSNGVDKEEQPAAMAAVGGARHAAESLDPEAERALVVGLEGFDAEDFEAGGFCGFQIAGERLGRDFGVESSGFGGALMRGPGEPVNEQEAARNQQGADAAEVVGKLSGRNLLEDGEVGDLVEGFRAIGLGAQVAAFHEGAALEPRLGDALADQGALRVARSNAVDVDAAMGGRPEEERAPSAGDVEEAIAALDAEGGKGAVDAGQLGGVEVIFGTGEEGAGVSQGHTQPGFEERDREAEGAGSLPPVDEDGMLLAWLEAARDVEADASDGLKEIAAEAFRLAQGIGGNGEQGGKVALDVEIAVEKDAREGGFRRVADNGVQAVAGREGGDEGGLMERGGRPGPAISCADGEGRAVILAKELVEVVRAHHIAGARGEGKAGAAGHHRFAT